MSLPAVSSANAWSRSVARAGSSVTNGRAVRSTCSRPGSRRAADDRGERGLGTEAGRHVELLADLLEPGIEGAVDVAGGPHRSYLRAPMNMPLSAS